MGAVPKRNCFRSGLAWMRWMAMQLGRTYSTVQNLDILLLCEHIHAGGIMLSDIESRTALEAVRLRVETPCRGHGDGQILGIRRQRYIP